MVHEPTTEVAAAPEAEHHRPLAELTKLVLVVALAMVAGAVVTALGIAFTV